MKKIAKYEIIEQIGKGGMGIVYKAFDPLMEREVAIKVLAEQLFDQPEIKERFYREARSAGKLSHENITIIHDLGEVEGKPYIVMEYLPGTDLKQIIKQKDKLSIRQKLDFSRQISKGLSFSHSKNIVHRDIKPENIRVLDDGKIKIMDFGIARPTTSTMTRTGMTMGTPHYMSPEQIRGEKVGHQSDIFSFGVLMYELFTYKLPFEGEDTTVIWYKIVHEQSAPFDEEAINHISGIRDIILKCLQKDANKRYKQISEVTKYLEQVIRLVEAREKETVDEEHRQVENLVAKSRKFLQKGDFKKAFEFADRVVKIAPDNELRNELIGDIKTAESERIAELLSSGRSSLNKKDFESAAKNVRAALGINPDHLEALKLKTEIAETKRAVESEAQTIVVERKLQKPVRKKVPPEKMRSNSALLIAGAVFIGLVGLLYRMFIYTAMPPVGYVALNVLPWAEVTKIVNGEGEEMNDFIKPGLRIVTPYKLSMPPGSYKIFFENPAFTTLAVDVVIKQGAVQQINQKLPGFDYKEILSNF